MRPRRVAPYSGAGPARPPQTALTAGGAALRLAACGAIGLALAGCAGMGFTDPIVTGSVTAKPAAYHRGEPLPEGVSADDWASARRALGDALAARAGAPSVPWENPATGMHGTATPLGEATAREGTTCREFLVSLVREADQRWLQGEACRKGRADWAVDQVRMLERSGA